MATEVEVKSPLTAMTSLTDLSEMTNERISQRAYIGPLSDASNKASELSNPPSLLIVEEKSRLGSALKPAATSIPGSRPRISPKPFKPSDPFEVRKIPITSPTQNNLIKSSLHGKPRQAAPDEALNGNAPSVDQKLNDADITGKNTFTAKKIFYSMPETNSLTSDTACKSLRFTHETEIIGEQSVSQFEVVSAFSPIYQKSEGVLYSEMSGSSRTNMGPIEPHRTGENKYSCMNDKSKALTKSVTTEETSPTKVQLRTKRRPVSAVFLESLKDSNPENRGISEVPLADTADKPWVRKSRPLSVDITAKFESKFTPQKKNGHTSEEAKENIPLLNSANRFSQEQTKIISKEEGMQVKGRSESFKHKYKSNKQNDDFQLGEEKREALSKDVTGLISETTKELFINTLGETGSKWESKYKCEKEENEKKTDVPVDGHKLEKRPVALNDTSESNKRWTLSNTTDITPVTGEKPASKLCKEETKSPGGSIQRRISLLLAVNNNSSPVSTELASAEREKRNVDIQKRIKDFTAENVDVKPGSLRKSFKSRPLSADLTKMFSAQTPTSEMKSQSVLELHTESPTDTQDKQESVNEKNKEEKLYGRTGLGDPLTEKVHWKISANPPEKMDHFEKGSFSKEEKQVSLSNKNCLSKTNHLDRGTSHAIPSESMDLKTVRATLFEHNIQRHSAVETYPVVDHTLKLASKTDKKSDTVDSLVLEEPLQRRNLEDKVHLNLAGEPEQRIAYNEQNRRFYDPPLNNHSSLENLRERTSKYIEDTLNYQRIEPRYEIIQTIGERARSESITLAAEDKAVTLRSRKSFHTQENETKKSNDNVLHSDWSCSLLDAEAVSFRDVTLCPVPKNILEMTTNKPSFTDPRPVSVQTFTVQEDINQPVKLQDNHSVKLKKTSSFTHIDKRSGIARNKVMSIGNLGEKHEKPKVLECFSDSTVIKAHGVDTSNSSITVDKQVSSTNVNRRLISGYEDSQSNDFFIDNQPRTELIAVDKGESRMFGLKKYQEVDRMRKDEDGTKVNNREGKWGPLEVGGKVSKIGSTTTDLSISEQLGMMPLPDDESTHEKSKRLVQDITKSSCRGANLLQSTESSVARENKKCQEPAGSEESIRLQDPIPEPKATYFAVTCHFSNKKKDIFQSPLKHDDFMFSNQGKPESGRKNPQTFIHDKDVSLETTSKKPDKRQDWETVHFSKQYLPNENTKPDEDYSGWRTPHKNLGSVTKIDDDSLLKERRTSNSNAEGKILSDNEAYVSPLQKDSRKFARKKDDETSGFIAEPKNSYRYSVLDIDELMANYKPELLKVGEIDSKQYDDQVHQSQFNKERSRSLKNYVDKPLNWKSQKNSMQSCSSFAEVSNKPLNVTLGFSQESNNKIDSFNQNVNKQNLRDTQISHHNWEKLGDPSERPSDSPSETRDNKKRITKIADEEQVSGLSGMQQYNIKHKDYGSGSAQVSLQPDSDASLNSISSRVTADSLLQKALSRNFQRSEMSVESSSQSNTNYSSEVLKSKGSAIRTSDGNDFNKSKASTESSVSITRSRPARVKDITLLMQEDKEKRSEEKPKQSFHLETSGVKKRNSTRRERGSTDDKMQDTEKDWTRNSEQGSGMREAPAAVLHKRSRSLRERREEPQRDQLKQCFTRPSPVTKDTDTLVREADSQYGTWSGEGDEESYLPVSPPDNAASARKQQSSSRFSSSSTEVDSHDSTSDQRHRSLDRCSVEMDSADSTEKQVSASPSPGGEAVDFSFLDQTSVLDSSALKNRVQLSRRSQRRAPTYHSQRRSKVLQDKQLTIQEDTDSTWMFKDSTEEKPETQEDSAEEDKPQRPTVQPQRLPVFPGMDPSVLKAQLRKKQESDSTSDAPGSAKLLKSPKSPLQQGVLGGRPLPSPTEENGPEAASPQWLKELKSKKRLSQYENQV
ncbi:uncharacterized protein KIAA1671 homolog isoform X2 [Microcaecilia unicolor]|uniref:Uncharacterized protein KIAA1671 homolog isoform X2 n=1 Tax=Microcaecilia unicolor TaxID=1415580 RepID=A0A6P7ZNJ6_9AMPH|nr:uncharacterized protein KIAA1671 homolog isoform X2 [Microcaecilia unicolor]